MTGLGSPNEWTHAALGSESDESLDQVKPTTQPRPTSTLTSGGDRPRPLSSATIGTTVTIIRPNNFAMRFSGAPGHPVHPRHFLKEFRIAMRDLGMTSDKERMEAFEDYLVVDSPAEQWYATRCGDQDASGEDNVMDGHGLWEEFQAAFLERFRGEIFDAISLFTAQNSDNGLGIKCVKFRQDAAVSAYIKATWKLPMENSSRALDSDSFSAAKTEETSETTEVAGDKEEMRSVKLGKFKPIATEENFVLADYNIPNGAQVRFTSHVWGVGEYSSEDDQWFTHDAGSTKGADFRQSGTAFKGWFSHTGKFDL